MTMKLVPVLALFLALSGVAEACQQYRDVVHDRNGNVLSGVSITVKRSGVSTATTIYSDSLCATISANPITSGSTGEFIFYAIDGQYDIDMSKVGYTFIPITDLSIYDPLGEHVLSAAKYQTDDICATGAGAIDQNGATVATLLISRPMTCGSIKVVPPTLTLAFDGQGDFHFAGRGAVVGARGHGGSFAAVRRSMRASGLGRRWPNMCMSSIAMTPSTLLPVCCTHIDFQICAA